MTAVFLTAFIPILLQSSVGDPNRFNNYLIMGYFVMFLVGLIYIASLIIRKRIKQAVNLKIRILYQGTCLCLN